MPHVLVIGHVRPEGMRLLDRPGITVDVLEQPGPDAILAAMPRTDAVVVRTTPITAAMIDAAPGLRVLSRHGVGYDSVDLAALERRGIPLAIAATSNRIAVAEQAFFMLLELVKHGRAFDAAVRADDWASRVRLVPVELAGRTLLLLGFGRVGREVARRALAFGMRVTVHDPFVPAEAVTAAGAVPAPDLMAALAEAHAVSLHLPLGPETRNVIGREQLRAMRREAVLVNTARGGLVDEAALAVALREGWIAGAGLDVFADEPPPADHPLYGLPNALFSPHIAGVTAEASVRMAVESVENALAALDGRLDPAVVVNPHVLDR